ncbi:MAG: serine--tRNA ligase [Candidatus Brocadiae bacterium]|nr:serine--tRNA ligase [Candidatus Brocadiia bacterium]
MLDINVIRESPDGLKEGLRKVGEDPAVIDRVRELDAEWRELVAQAEEMKAERNRQSKVIGGMEQGAERDGLIARMREVGDKIGGLDARAAEVREQLDDLMLRIPNIPHEHVPPGLEEEDDVVVRTQGERPAFDFKPRPHWELGPELGILDFERGVKLSGSRFYVLMGDGSRLQRALINWMLDLHVAEHGYVEASPPFIVGGRCLVGTGELPKFRDNLYRDVEDDLWLIPTAEAPLTNLHRDEVLAEEELPRHYCAYTPCFRREKMSAGKDVRGIKRGHQFDKVEMVKYVRPDTSEEELQKLVANAEDVCKRLGLPYRVRELCCGQMSFQASHSYDVEVWAAGCEEWLEVSSCSNCGDFQARRANIRYRPAEGGRPRFVHTLNGSGVALPRTVIAVLENYQQADGTVIVPEALRSTMGGLERIGPQ